ncbi:DUF5361 domain-containing protein [Corynebacterium sp. USCH3]|uniref:DUF5361 domain-containing protein n=1 Tax=Corynebacterium sp. USCH3 TaxID=3024840 RepID=UPI0030A11F99
MTYYDVWVMLSCAAPGSAVARLTDEGDRSWTLTDHLMATLVDVANLLLWSKTEDAQHKRNQPERVPRPGDEYEGKHRGEARDENTEHLGEVTTAGELEDLFSEMYG